MRKNIKNLSLVKFTPKMKSGRYPKLIAGKTYLFLGEISNMPEHCAVCDIGSGKVIVGFHSDNFTVLKAEEV